MNLCVYSSFIYLSNSIVALLYNYYIYSFLFLLLFCTSILFHLHNNIYTLLLDKVSIIAIVFYGGYIFYNNHKTILFTTNLTNKIIPVLIISTFIVTIFLYYYGYMYNKYCYYEDKDIANQWHSIIHIVSSIGHHLNIISL